MNSAPFSSASDSVCVDEWVCEELGVKDDCMRWKLSDWRATVEVFMLGIPGEWWEGVSGDCMLWILVEWVNVDCVLLMLSEWGVGVNGDYVLNIIWLINDRREFHTRNAGWVVRRCERRCMLWMLVEGWMNVEDCVLLISGEWRVNGDCMRWMLFGWWVIVEDSMLGMSSEWWVGVNGDCKCGWFEISNNSERQYTEDGASGWPLIREHFICWILSDRDDEVLRNESFSSFEDDCCGSQLYHVFVPAWLLSFSSDPVLHVLEY